MLKKFSLVLMELEHFKIKILCFIITYIAFTSLRISFESTKEKVKTNQ